MGILQRSLLFICVNLRLSIVICGLRNYLFLTADTGRSTQINADKLVGLLECCRQHKVLVADLFRNCTIAIPLGPTNSPSQFQSQKNTKIQPTESKKPDLWDENLPKWIDHRARSRGILPERLVAIAPIAWSASQGCCVLVSNRQSGKGIDSAKAST